MMANEAEERAAIADTMATYSFAGDRMRIAEMAATFVEDGVLVTPTARYEGRAAIVAGLSGRRPGAAAPSGPRPSLVRHNLTTSQVKIKSAATAEARTYFIVFTDIGPDQMGHYVDRLRKTPAGWRFVHRDVRIDWMSEQSLFQELKAAYDARRRGRG